MTLDILKSACHDAITELASVSRFEGSALNMSPRQKTKQYFSQPLSAWNILFRLKRFLHVFSIIVLAANASYATLLASAPTIGLPISRTYSIEEIGASRGPQLTFDRLGRLTVLSSGSYIVLNDNAWIDLAVHSSEILPILGINIDGNGYAYFGALASWGIAENTSDGRIHPVSLRPPDYPSWVNSTNFTQIVTIPSGVVFGGTNGFVHLDPETGEQRFFQKAIASIFSLDSQLYISSSLSGTERLNFETGEFETVDPLTAVFDSVPFGSGKRIAATTNNRLVVFDGEQFSEPSFGFSGRQANAISCLESLPDGGFAVAIDSVGLFLFDPEGTPKLSLTTSDYRQIFDLAVHDPGILWLARESSVEKLLYNNPVSVVDQRSDVVIGWPQVVQHNESTLIASSGRLYKMVASANDWQFAFQEFENVPTSGAWAIASNEEHLLIGNSDGVYALRNGRFHPALENFDANRIFLQESDLCIAVGSREITAIRWNGESWEECAQRIKGVGFPSVAHRSDEALWVELGLDRVARIWFENDEIHVATIEDFPWDEPVWVNIGLLEDYVVLSGSHNQRVYIQKGTTKVVRAPEFEETLSLSPETILRVSEDTNGTIWATHPTGVVTFHKKDGRHQIDSKSLSSIRDQYPVITLIEGEHAWISTESALYHVDQEFEATQSNLRQPFLVSVADGKNGQLLFSASLPTKFENHLPYSQNHLVFRYFSGGYEPLLNPSYEFSMVRGSENWTVQSPDSILTLPSLEEGSYQLTAQLWEGSQPIGNPIVTSFVIHPPWFRSHIAYFSYLAAGILACYLILSWSLKRSKQRQLYLEKLVNERTDELRTTMDKLTEEARTSATLAERNRLAGEIHDSLQQGLSGLALQLDATARLNDLSTDLKTRIQVARKMVTFTRQEVQQAVWDLESPLLQNDDLTEALRNMAELLNTGPSQVVIKSEGAAPEFPSRTKHHVLRIAQEAITNAVRHSEAETIEVRLYQRDQSAYLDVIDNGKGFNQEETLSGGLGHFGLRGLRTRALKIGGDLRIESQVGFGTTVQLIIPLPQSSETNFENNGQ